MHSHTELDFFENSQCLIKEHRLLLLLSLLKCPMGSFISHVDHFPGEFFIHVKGIGRKYIDKLWSLENTHKNLEATRTTESSTVWRIFHSNEPSYHIILINQISMGTGFLHLLNNQFLQIIREITRNLIFLYCGALLHSSCAVRTEWLQRCQILELVGVV